MQQFEQYSGRTFAIMGEVVMVLTFIRISFYLDEHMNTLFLFYYFNFLQLSPLFMQVTYVLLVNFLC